MQPAKITPGVSNSKIFPLTPATLDIFHVATRIMWTIPENGFGFRGNTHTFGLTASGGVRGSNITRNTGVRLTFGREFYALRPVSHKSGSRGQDLIQMDRLTNIGVRASLITAVDFVDVR